MTNKKGQMFVLCLKKDTKWTSYGKYLIYASCGSRTKQTGPSAKAIAAAAAAGSMVPSKLDALQNTDDTASGDYGEDIANVMQKKHDWRNALSLKNNCLMVEIVTQPVA